MPPRGLPGSVNLEKLMNGAKSFQRAVRAGDAGAAEVVREFHPRLGAAQPGTPELDAFKRADAQLVVARSFGFPRWPKLKAYLEVTPRYSRSPHAQPIGEPIRDQQALVDEFLRLACLTYGGDDPARWATARELLVTNPELAAAAIHTIAAVGLELLIEFGPGTGDGGRWRRLLAPVHGTPREMLDEQLMAAARSGFAGHVRLLLDHGADPEARGTRNHEHEIRTPREEAMLRGHRDCAELLRAAGATSGTTPLYAFMEAATDGDRDRVQQLLARDPTLTDQAIAGHPDQLVRAAQNDSVEGVALLIALGFDVNAVNRLERFHESAPLHEAAAEGNLEMIELLLARGADPNLRDNSYDATPAGWAEHFNQMEAQRYLAALET